jgi:hypothetical protein
MMQMATQIIPLLMRWLQNCGWSLANARGKSNPKNICEHSPVGDLTGLIFNGSLFKNTGECLSLDNTFRSAGKASVVDTKRARTNIMKGGLLSGLNERNEIVCWVGLFLSLMAFKT